MTGFGDFAGRSKYSGQPPDFLVRFYENLPLDDQENDLKCAEIDGIIQAIHAYEQITGAHISSIEQAREVLGGSQGLTALVRKENTRHADEHGMPKAPCKSCQPLLDAVGITSWK
jgi:hypothetical protein